MVEILGIPTRDCPPDDCPQYNCYQECEHRNKVLDSLQAKPLRKQGFLYDLIQSILAVQEEMLEWMCREPDIVELGTSLGFPPLQCGKRQYRPGPVIECPVTTCYGCEEEPKTSCDGFLPPGCNPCRKPLNSCANVHSTCDEFDCRDLGTCNYPAVPGCEWCRNHELIPYMTSCSGETSCSENTSCPDKLEWVDLSQGDYLPIYTAIVNWLKCCTARVANGELIGELLALLGGRLIGIYDGIYSIELPNDETLLSIIDVIKNILPLPVGAEIRLHTEVCHAF